MALKDDEVTVVASGLKAKQVLDDATKMGYQHPIMLKVPKKVIAYVG